MSKKTINRKKISKNKRRRVLRNITLKKRLSGGKKIGQGSFGCVITPAIKCNNTTVLPQQSISKIIYTNPNNKEKYTKEVNILKKINEIDKKQKYLIGVIDECQLDINELKNRKFDDYMFVNFTDDKHKHWVKSKNSSQNISQLSEDVINNKYCLIDSKLSPRNQIQVYGGHEFDIFLNNPRSKEFTYIRRYYINILKNILIGIQLMHNANIVHRDIKPENMVCNLQPLKYKTRNNVLFPIVRHIDFGLAEFVKPEINYTLRDVRYAGTNGYIPPDIIILTSRLMCMRKIALTKNNLGEYVLNLDALSIPSNKQLVIDDMYKYSKEKYKKYSSMGKEFVSKLDLSMLYDMLLNELLNGSFNYKYKSKYNGYLYKSDVFAAGILFDKMKYKLGIKNPKLLDLINNMTMVDPNKRYNINQCLAHPLFK